MDRFRNTRQPDWDWWARLWPAPGETLRRLGVSEGDSLAEIGCGNGYFALPGARIVDPAPVYAVDIDGSCLAELARLADRQAIDNVVPTSGNARSLPETLPEPVDVGLIANTFHGVEDPAPFLDGVTATLTEGGRFVVVNWEDRPRERTTVAGEARGPPTDLRLSPAETRALVEDATELTATDRIDLPPYHYALVFAR